jgi:4-hydroxyacetophenone monooxygenase
MNDESLVIIWLNTRGITPMSSQAALQAEVVQPHHIDVERLAAAIVEADLRVLLMVLVHLTGDLTWLDPPFRPKRDVRLIPDANAGLAVEIQETIRSAALNCLSDGAVRPAIADPGSELLRLMMSICLGEDVPLEYAHLAREEMGLVVREPSWQRPPAAKALEQRRVLIVGAGVSGIALAVSLGRLGIPFLIVEKNAGLGGAWYENRYPGCGVDTPNHSYSYSFGPRHRWSRYFSPREEVQEYLEKIVDTFDVRGHVRFKTRLLGAHWDERRHCWIAQAQNGKGVHELEAAYLVSAIGQLSDPSIPNIKGADSFKGPLFHSACWPEELDVAGKHLAVIGTGATAMQLVPTVVDLVASVAVFQRTAQWARPIERYGDPISEGMQWLIEHVPFYAEWFRFNMFWRYGDGLLPTLRKDSNWPHPERSVNRANDRHRQEMERFIRAELAGRPDLLTKCIPSYPAFGKRILLDNGWYRTLLRPNMHLVTEAIDHIGADAVVTTDGTRHHADIVVLATGFRLTEMAARLNIVGKAGVSLADTWRDDNPQAYLGLSVPGFPNFFCMLGPNSGPAHGGSVIFQAECQTRYIASCLVQMIERDIASIDLKPEVLEAYVRSVDAEHEQLIWTHPGVETYYRNRHGRVFSVMPWRFVDYWQMTHDADLDDYWSDVRPSLVN